MPRRVIQIDTTPSTRQHGEQVPVTELYALCDDGTVWVAADDEFHHGEDAWHEVPGVPQPEGERRA